MIEVAEQRRQDLSAPEPTAAASITGNRGSVMATPPTALSVDQLVEAVGRLSPAQRREFQRRIASRRARNGEQEPDEASLVRAAKARLPATAAARLKRLIARSERGDLTPKELADYQALAQIVQRIDAARAEALAELARRRGRSVEAVTAELGREGDADGP
jgi:hypothetical protein